MNFSRRDFHKILGLGLLSFSFPSGGQVNKSEDFPSGVPMLQGATSAQSTQISILGLKNSNYKFECYNQSLSLSIHINKIEVHEKDFSDWVIYNLYIENLDPNYFYELKIVRESDGKFLDNRTFQTLDLNKENLYWAFGSCMYDGTHKKEIWQSLQEQNADFIIFVGDSVYIDRKWGGSKEVSEQRLWGRHVQARLTLDIYYWQHLKPVFATWDDHDYGLNNSNRAFVLKHESQGIFNIFFPFKENVNLTKGPGVSKKISTNNQDFYLLDNRSFRSEKGANDEQFFGNDQMSWLESNVNSKKLSWLMQGSQWTTTYDRTENFSKTHPDAFKETFSRLKSLNAPFILCSGDVHFSEIVNVSEDLLGYKTLELTSSSFHSRSVPGFNYVFKNKDRIVGTNSNNYLIINSQFTKTVVTGQINCLSFDKRKSKFLVDLNKVQF